MNLKVHEIWHVLFVVQHGFHGCFGEERVGAAGINHEHDVSRWVHDDALSSDQHVYHVSAICCHDNPVNREDRQLCRNVEICHVLHGGQHV